MPKGSPMTESKVLDIVPCENEAQSASSHGGSIHRSPFSLQVAGAGSIGAISNEYYTPEPESTTEMKKQGKVKDQEKQKWRELENMAAPEKYLTIFAMRLAVLEKIASGVGTLAFIWATVVILGGYGITMKEKDFWFVTIILVTEGARIFSRSHELEWQHQTVDTNMSFADRARRASSNAYKIGSHAIHKSAQTVRTTFSAATGPGGARLAKSRVESPLVDSEKRDTDRPLKRTWSSSRVPMVPYMTWTFQARNVSRLLYLMQLASAIASIVLSAIRLCQQQFSREGEGDTEKNHKSALNIFYSLAVVEATVFLIERAYWEWKILGKKVLIEVTKLCGLQSDSLNTIRRFFYDVYSKCLSGSVFEGLKMDLVEYCVTLLQSDIADEQLGGLRVLAVFVGKEEYADNTLRRIGTMQGFVERLIDMITWKNPQEYEIRKLAAELLCKLVKYSSNCVRVAAISGSIDSILTLLDHEKEDGENCSQTYGGEGGSEVLATHQIDIHIVGLRILKNLAKDHANCAKLGNRKGLLIRLVSYIDADTAMLRNKGELGSRVKIVKKSLELLKRISCTPGFSGKVLREEIAKVVFTVANVRNIIEYGQDHVGLQQRAIDILSGLALDDEVREVVGRTGGIIRNLFFLFLKENLSGDSNELHLAKTAGETLTLLGLQSEKNCLRMLRLKLKVGDVEKDIIGSLIGMMENWELGHLAIRILRGFCTYTTFADKMRIVSCISRVMKLVVDQTGKIQEAAIGLAACSITLISKDDFDFIFTQEFTKPDLLKKLRKILEHHQSPSITLPRIRRFTLELIVSLADKDASIIKEFQCQKFDSLLEKVLDTQSDVENFATFSGAVGVTRHRKSMDELVEVAIGKLQLEENVVG